MRFAGTFEQEPDDYLVASYDDRNRHRNEASILYKFIMGGGLGDPRNHQDTLKRLQDQMSGVRLPGV